MRMSVTFLSSYLYCPRKLYLEKALGIKPLAVPEAMVKGSIRHQVFEGINQEIEGLVKGITEPDFERIYSSFREKFLSVLRKATVRNKEKLKDIKIPILEFFSDTKPSIINEASYRADKIFRFIQETGYLGEKLWENLTPKVRAEYRIENPQLELVGVIDELEVYPNYFVPIELKTGKAPSQGVWPGHKIQVAAYALLLQSHFGVCIEKGIVRYLDTNQAREVIMNPFLMEEVRDTMKKVKEMLCSKELPDFPENDCKCRNCDLKDACHDNEKLAEAQSRAAT